MRYFIILPMLVWSSASVWGSGFSNEIFTSKKWNSANHPRIFFSDYNPKLDAFPMADTLDENHAPWSDSYWPRYKGGIAFRWQIKQRISARDILTKKKVFKLEQKELNALSPAEKFDILNNDYDFSFARKVLRENPKNAPGWQGICHGWAEAVLHHPSGELKQLRNKDGIQIELAASDINALLSYYYAKEKRGKVYFLGQRCRGSGRSYKCQGMNPGAFHIALVESVARNQSFVVDIDPKSEVWNQPIFGYKFRILSERTPSKGAAKYTAKEVQLEMILTYIGESSSSRTRKDSVKMQLPMKYWLELDAKNQIIGGSWQSIERVDFAWYRQGGSLPTKYRKYIK